MGASPPWKVYRANNEYIASCKLPEYAAMILAGLGEDGATIRLGHRNVAAWTEGKDGHAFESYDVVARTCYQYPIAATPGETKEQ